MVTSNKKRAHGETGAVEGAKEASEGMTQEIEQQTRRTTMSDHSEQSVPPTWPAPRQEDRIWTPSGICIDAWCDHDDFCPGPVVPRG